jgi:hypothetical protein
MKNGQELCIVNRKHKGRTGIDLGADMSMECLVSSTIKMRDGVHPVGLGGFGRGRGEKVR